MKVERTHDKLYLKENYKNNPKEYYKLCGDLIENDFGGKNQKLRVMDVGCETGSFLYYLKNRFSSMELFGMDVMPELIDALRNGGINANGIIADISDEKTLPNEKFDIVTMLGVMSIFDDFRPIISNLMKMLKLGGVAYIFGIFNPENLDVLIKSKASDDKSHSWETGWNYFSIKSVELFLKENGIKYDFIPFSIGIDIEKHDGDPLRSWTVMMPDNERMIINGLQLVHHFYFLRLRK